MWSTDSDWESDEQDAQGHDCNKKQEEFMFCSAGHILDTSKDHKAELKCETKAS